MDIQGISAASTIANAAQQTTSNPTATAKPEQATEQPFLEKLELLGADHPLTKFLGGFYSQHVDTEA